MPDALKHIPTIIVVLSIGAAVWLVRQYYVMQDMETALEDAAQGSTVPSGPLAYLGINAPGSYEGNPFIPNGNPNVQQQMIGGRWVTTGSYNIG